MAQERADAVARGRDTGLSQCESARHFGGDAEHHSRSPTRHPSASNLCPPRWGVQFSAGAEFAEKLERARELLSHALPGGELAAIFERALDALASARHG